MLLLAGNLVALARVPDFPWSRFFEVAKWALLAYVVIAGMIEYSFLRDHIKGGVLVVLTLSLVVFAVHVPVLVGFTVARFDEPEEPAADGMRAKNRAGLRLGKHPPAELAQAEREERRAEADQHRVDDVEGHVRGVGEARAQALVDVDQRD